MRIVVKTNKTTRPVSNRDPPAEPSRPAPKRRRLNSDKRTTTPTSNTNTNTNIQPHVSNTPPPATSSTPTAQKDSHTATITDGYNSGDEHKPRKRITYEQLVAQENQLQSYIKEKGFTVVPMKEDGNCMFRAVAHQIYGEAEMHDQIRKLCTDFMLAERDHYSQYVVEDFEDYVERKRKNGCFGNSLELQAIAELFNRPVEVYSNKKEPLNIFHGEFVSDAPIRVSYHNNNHYNSVVDPNHTTFGVGLGLPELETAGQTINEIQVEKAIEESQQEALLSDVLEESEREFIDSTVLNSLGVNPTLDQMDVDAELEKAIQKSKEDLWAKLIQETAAQTLHK